jgi:hypothetical protein
LDAFFADVAGLCSTGSRLQERPRERLKRGKKFLKMGFFERHPELAHIQSQITPGQTPRLYDLLKYSEQARLALLDIFEVLEID